MPPSPRTPIDTDHLPRPPVAFGEGGLPAHHNSSAGPVIGIVIILILLIVGALYFVTVRMHKENTAQDQRPYILSGTTTITVKH